MTNTNDSKQTFQRQEVTSERFLQQNAFVCFRDPAYWDAVRRAKSAWIVDGVDPRDNETMRAEVAVSWVLAQEQQMQRMAGQTELEEDNHILSENDTLMIAAARPLFRSYQQTASYSDCTLELFNPESVILLGKKITGSERCENNDKTEETDSIQYLKCHGVLSHTMAMRDNRPCVMVGPELYWDQFSKLIGYSAPIVNSLDEVIGAVLFVRKFQGNPWDAIIPRQCAHTLGWVTALAAAIGRQVDFAKSDKHIIRQYEELKHVNDEYQSAIDICSNPIMVVSTDFDVLRANKAAVQTFRIDAQNMHLYNLYDIVEDMGPVRRAVDINSEINGMVMRVRIGKGSELFRLSMKPAHEQNELDQSAETRKTETCIFIFAPCDSREIRLSLAKSMEGFPSMKSMEREVIIKALEMTNFNIQATAAQLNISRSTLYRKMKKHHLQK